jgi:S1-C subfamily serine protease
MKKFIWFILIVFSTLVLSSCSEALNFEDVLDDYYIGSIDEITVVNSKASNTVDDYTALFNQVSLDAIKGNVTVYTTSFDGFLMFSTNQQTYFGSGVIFYETESYYYVLTNEHVAVKSESRNNVKYAIYDYLGNEYRAFLYEGSLSKDDDLAVLFFPKGSDELKMMTFNEAQLSASDQVIAIGQPKGQENTITFGEIIDFGPTSISNRNDELVTRDFEAIKHDARVNSGSSGGMLLDYNLNVIGINFASSQNEETFLYSLAIPISIVINYIETFIIVEPIEGSE